MAYTWHYYDLVLLSIGGSLAVGVGIGTVTDIAFTTAVIAAALGAVGIVAHALFVNGPVDRLEDLTDEVDTDRLP